MREFLLCTNELASKTRFIPAHFIYKIKDSRLLRGQIPINLRGGMMAIGRIEGALPPSLASSIASECLRRAYIGALVALPPVPSKESVDFAKALATLFSAKKLELHIPISYSFCCNAHFLLPGMIHSGSFYDYLNDTKEKPLSIELSCCAFELQIPRGESAVPISQDELNSALSQSGAMTFYSDKLCTNYFTHDGKFILFDTPETLAVKRKVAESVGIDTCFYLISPKNKTALAKLEAQI